MSKCELSHKVLAIYSPTQNEQLSDIANFCQINHSPTFGRAFTW